MSLLLEHALNFTKIPGICAARMHLKKFSYFNGKAVLESHFSVSTADSSISWYNERSSSVSLLSGFEVCFFFLFQTIHRKSHLLLFVQWAVYFWETRNYWKKQKHLFLDSINKQVLNILIPFPSTELLTFLLDSS